MFLNTARIEMPRLYSALDALYTPNKLQLDNKAFSQVRLAGWSGTMMVVTRACTHPIRLLE